MVKTSISMGQEILDRIDKVVEEHMLFRSRSHFFEVAIDNELQKYEGERDAARKQ